MTTSTKPRWLHAALSAAVLALVSLGLVSCTEPAEPEMTFVEALQAALDKAHDAHADQGNDTLDDIAAAAYEQIDAALEAGDINESDAENLRGWVARAKAEYEAAVQSGRMTMEEACEAFRRDIVNLAIRLQEHAENS